MQTSSHLEILHRFPSRISWKTAPACKVKLTTNAPAFPFECHYPRTMVVRKWAINSRSRACEHNTRVFMLWSYTFERYVHCWMEFSYTLLWMLLVIRCSSSYLWSIFNNYNRLTYKQIMPLVRIHNHNDYNGINPDSVMKYLWNCIKLVKYSEEV